MLIGIWNESTGVADTGTHTVVLEAADGSGSITATHVGATNIWTATGLQAGKIYNLKIDSATKLIILGDAETLQVHMDGHGSGTGAEAGMIVIADLGAAVLARMFTSSTVKGQVEGLNNGGVVAQSDDMLGDVLLSGAYLRYQAYIEDDATS